MLTHLEYVDLANNNYKFWEAELSNSSTTLIIRWGRIGTRGQSKSYEFSSHSSASINYYEKVGEKIRKGYQYTCLPATPTTFTTPQQIQEKKEEETTIISKPKQGHRSLSQYME